MFADKKLFNIIKIRKKWLAEKYKQNFHFIQRNIFKKSCNVLEWLSISRKLSLI